MADSVARWTVCTPRPECTPLPTIVVPAATSRPYRPRPPDASRAGDRRVPTVGEYSVCRCICIFLALLKGTWTHRPGDLCRRPGEVGRRVPLAEVPPGNLGDHTWWIKCLAGHQWNVQQVSTLTLSKSAHIQGHFGVRYRVMDACNALAHSKT